MAVAVAGIVAAWTAGSADRRHLALSDGRRVLLSVSAGILAGCVTLIVIGIAGWIAMVIWFTHFSHFVW